MKNLAIIFGATAILALGSVGATAASMTLAITDAGKTLSGDPAKGKAVFNRCMICHSVDKGVNHIGPSLHGIVGRKSGSVADYSYSAANKQSGIIWTQQKIFDYLKNPQMMVPGTKMIFAGLPRAQDRADVVAYLQENSK